VSNSVTDVKIKLIHVNQSGKSLYFYNSAEIANISHNHVRHVLQKKEHFVSVMPVS